MAGAEVAVGGGVGELRDLAMEVIQELQVAAGEAGQGGEAVRARVVAGAEAVTAARTSGLETKALEAITDLSPLNQETLAGRPTLNTLAWGSVILGALDVGKLGGRFLGGIILGYLIQPSMAVLSAGLILPLSFLVYVYASQTGGNKEQHQAGMVLGILSGFLSGFALREYALANIMPEVVGGILNVVLSPLLAMSPLASMPDRTGVLGALVGARMGLTLILDVVTGSVSGVGLIGNILRSAAQAASLQLVWGETKAPGLGGTISPSVSSAILTIAFILPSIAIDLIVAPIAGSPPS